MARHSVVASGRAVTAPPGFVSFVLKPLTRLPHEPARLFLLTALAICAGAAPGGATMPTRSGTIEPPVRAAFEAGLFDLPVQPGRPGTSATASAQSVWHIPVIMVGFADDTLEFSASEFEFALFDTTGSTPTGSVFDYFQWVSEGRLRVTGDVVAVVQLPQTREWYAALSYGLTYFATPNNSYGLVYDALARTHRSVDWSRFDQDRDGYVDMLWVLHAGPGAETSLDRNHLWSITSRMTGGWRGGSPFVTEQLLPGAYNVYYRLDRFTILPEVSGLRPGNRAEIGVFCHEFGHTLGLPDLYDTSTLGGAANAGPGYWSLMATGSYGGNGSSPEFPTHVGAWASRFLGWRNTVRPTRDTTMTLAPMAAGGDIVEFWFQGQQNPEHFLLEVRERAGFDRTLNAPGLIVTHVDEAAIGARLSANRVNAGPTPGLWLVEADGDSDLVVGRNRGDAYDPFPGLGGRTALAEDTWPDTRTFDGATTTIGLRHIVRVGSAVRFDMQVRAGGWRPASAVTAGAFVPSLTLSNGRPAAADANGNVHVVTSESRAGRPQVVLRTRTRAGQWEPEVQLSASAVAALDPTIAVLPGGDLAVAWSDASGGRQRILYRARIRGTWTEPRVVGDVPGQNAAPALGADAAGRVHLAWLGTQSDVPAVWALTFMYFAPFGAPARLTTAGELPRAPALAVQPDGTSIVAWLDAASAPQRIWFRRGHPDSGFAERLALTPPPYTDQTAFSIGAGPDGSFHAVWVTSGNASREIHWQRRRGAAGPAPMDSVIETRSAFLQNMHVEADPSGGVHLAFESAPAGTPQTWYKRWRPGFGWDFASTEITEIADGSGSRPSVIAWSHGNVLLLYTDYAGAPPRLVERERRLDPLSPVAVDPAPPPPVAAALAVGPNPAHAGAPLRFRLAPAAAGDAIEVFDIAGRRVAVAPVAPGADEARLDGTVTARLGGGVYFARVRGSDARARVVVLR